MILVAVFMASHEPIHEPGGGLEVRHVGESMKKPMGCWGALYYMILKRLTRFPHKDTVSFVHE